MSRGYTSSGKRLSSMTHASRGEDCAICGQRAYGNGGIVSHSRSHVRRGEAVELVKEYEFGMSPSRFFLKPDDPQIAWFLDRGFSKVEP